MGIYCIIKIRNKLEIERSYTMGSKIDKQENNVIVLEITVEADDVKKAYKEGAKKLADRVNIPGFRKGKVPAGVLEKHVGEGSIIEEAIDILLPEAYGKALDEHELEPIDKPNIEVVSIEKEGPFVFKAEVTLVPEGKLGKYKGLKLERTLVDLDETYVENELEALRTKNAKIENVETAAENGDTVVIDFTGYIGEEPFEGGAGEGYSLELGSQTFIPGFEEQLVGVKAGDEKDINITFPEEYHSDALKGKETVFKIKAHEVKRKKLADLDDEFAKDVSDFDTLKELTDDIRKNLTEQKQKAAENAVKNQALDLGIDIIEVDVPEVMISEKTDQFLKDIEMDMSQHGMTLEKYYETTGMSEEKVRADYRDNAIKHIKRDILLDAVAKAEGLTATEAEVDQEIDNMCKAYNQPKESLEAYFKAGSNLKMLKRGIAREKALEKMVELATVKEVKAEDKKEEKAPAKKPAAKKAPAKKAAEKKPAAKKATAEKKPAAKKTTTKKAESTTTAKKAPAKKTAASKDKEEK